MLFDDRELRRSRLSAADQETVDTWRLLANRVIPGTHDKTYMSMLITGGPRAQELAQEHQLPSIVELKSELGTDGFYQQVVLPNIAEGKQRNAAYAARHPEAALIVPTEIEGAMGGGANRKLSGDAFMAFWYDVLNHQAAKVVVPPGWALGNGVTEEAVEMTCIAAGLRERPNAGAGVYRVEDDSPVGLAMMAQEIATAFDHVNGAGHRAPVQATSLARLFHIHDLIQDGRITPEQTAEGFMDYDMAAMERLKQNYEPKLKQPEIAATVTLDGLDASYREAAARAHGSARPAVASRGPAPAG